MKNSGEKQEKIRNAFVKMYARNKGNNTAEQQWELFNRLLPGQQFSDTDKDALWMVFAMQNQPKAALFYQETAKWLPLFEEQLCDGNNVGSWDLAKLSKRFRAPVFAFSIYDSDVLMLSFCDDQNNRMYDHEKPDYDSEDWGECFKDGFCREFPAYLTEFCEQKDWDRLKAIWESEDCDADERMEKVAELTGMNTVYDFDSEIPGFEKITVVPNPEEMVP